MMKDDSADDFGHKRAEYVDEDGFYVASKENVDKLKNPKKIETNE